MISENLSELTLSLALALLVCSCTEPGAHHTPPDTATTDAPAAAPQRLRFTTGIRAILEDSQGNTWFGSHNEGAARYADGRYTYYTVADGLSDKQVRNIYEDGDGRIWLEGGKGISIYDGDSLRTVTDRNYAAPDHWAITDEQLWFKPDPPTGSSPAEGGSGVYGYDGQQLLYHLFPQSSGDLGTLSAGFVRGADGSVWFGTYSGVIGYDEEGYTVISNASLGLTEDTGFLHVRALFEDSRGRLWIGNNGMGVLLHEDGQTADFSKEQGLTSPLGIRRGGFHASTPTLEHVFAIGEDVDGNVWFGDRDTGAWRYDGTAVENFGVAQGLPVPHVWRIYRSRAGALWFGMADGSVQRFADGRFERVF